MHWPRMSCYRKEQVWETYWHTIQIQGFVESRHDSEHVAESVPCSKSDPNKQNHTQNLLTILLEYYYYA